MRQQNDRSFNLCSYTFLHTSIWLSSWNEIWHEIHHYIKLFLSIMCTKSINSHKRRCKHSLDRVPERNLYSKFCCRDLAHSTVKWAVTNGLWVFVSLFVVVVLQEFSVWWCLKNCWLVVVNGNDKVGRPHRDNVID